MATGKPFSLYRRKAGKRYIYYFRLTKPDGTRTAGRSTGQTSKGAAERWVLDYLERHGTPTAAGRISFDSWAREFWSPDGRYVRLRRAHGHSLGAHHVRTQHRLVRNYLLPRFGSLYLDQITTEHVESFLLEMYETGRSPYQRNGAYPRIGARTVNQIRACLKQILAEAVRLGHLKRNPVDAVFKFKESPKVRGVLSRAELWELLFRPKALEEVWSGERVYFLFTTTAAVTGARQGELRALQGRHIHREWIDIHHGWDGALNKPTDAPKWGHRRAATIPPQLGDVLTAWLEDIGAGPESWAFPSPVDPRQPVTAPAVTKRFRTALERIGIPEDRRRTRNIVFHSLRHSLVTAMRAESVDVWQAQNAVGHRTDRVFEAYGDHASPDDLKDVQRFQIEFMKKPENTGR